MSATDRMAAGAALPVGLASRVDRAFGLALEISTALLVVAEIVILFIGIVARYVLNRPLIWWDELASLLFLWLAMLGTVLTLRRGTCSASVSAAWQCMQASGRPPPFRPRLSCRGPFRRVFSAWRSWLRSGSTATRSLNRAAHNHVNHDLPAGQRYARPPS